MSEFKFTNAEWRRYQQTPDQGYSHRHHLEVVVNGWLQEHDREVAEKAWEEGITAFDVAITKDVDDPWSQLPDNPYRQQQD